MTFPNLQNTATLDINTDRLPLPASIAAYITAYQDTIALNACIHSLQTQTLLSAIYILDNSPQPLPLPPSQIPLIHNPQPQNIGIGHGLTLAITWALQERYQFLWLFDQDSQATPHCLTRLLQVYTHLQTQDIQPGILAPTPLTGTPPEPVLAAHHDRYRFIGQAHQPDRPYYPCIAPITSGSLLNLAAAQSIDPPNRDLFIDGVDIDYGMRLHQAGYPNYLVPSAILQHSFGTPHKIIWSGQTKILQNYSALRHYYICRNHTYLDCKYAVGYWNIIAILFRFKYLSATLFWMIFVLPDRSWLKIWACLKGTYDGFRGRLGKTWRNH
ncbi:MAG: glycosyltransferase family 2 protein [Prochlorothrix sp.]